MVYEKDIVDGIPIQTLPRLDIYSSDSESTDSIRQNTDLWLFKYKCIHSLIYC